MKLLIALTFFFFAFVASAQQATVSNGRSSITINNSLSIELSDSFLNATEIVVKLIDDNGSTIPCKRGTLVIQPKKGDNIVSYMTNKKSEFYLNTINIDRLSHLTSGSRVIFGFETYNKVRYPKFLYSFLITIR